MTKTEKNKTISIQKKAVIDNASILYFLIGAAIGQLTLNKTSKLAAMLKKHQHNYGHLVQNSIEKQALSDFKETIIQGNQQASNASIYQALTQLEKLLLNNDSLAETYAEELSELGNARTLLHSSMESFRHDSSLIDRIFSIFSPLNVALKENKAQYDQEQVSVGLIAGHEIVLKPEIEKMLLTRLNREKSTTASLLEQLTSQGKKTIEKQTLNDDFSEEDLRHGTHFDTNSHTLDEAPTKDTLPNPSQEQTPK